MLNISKKNVILVSMKLSTRARDFRPAHHIKNTNFQKRHLHFLPMKRKLGDASADVWNKDSKSKIDSSPGSRKTSTSYAVGNEAYNVHVTNKCELDKVTAAWFDKLNDSMDKVSKHFNTGIRAVVGLDCEWSPPWFRDNKPERVNTIQLYSPIADCLVLSVGEWDKLPAPLLRLLADKSIAKIGVNISGDGSRLARDFNSPVHGLLNLEKGRGPKVTLEKLCSMYCPTNFHIDKDSVESKVRLGNWAAWPLSELQLKYASMDAVLSFAVFLFQRKGTWEQRCAMNLPGVGEVALDSCLPVPEAERTELQRAPSTGGQHSNFYLMHQNRSIVPPNMHKKEHPTGSKDALKGKVIVVSGVLDSMSREEMTKYVVEHGGKVGKSITKGTTHLVNDHGAVGPAKLKKCEAQGVPVVGEDEIFALVKGEARQ